MLYRPEAFEPLTETAWDEERVRSSIRALVDDVDGACRGQRLLWRAHEWDNWHATSPMKNLYVGAAGVVWALDDLQRRGQAGTRLDLGAVASRALELFRERPDFIKGMKLPAPAEAALLTGEAGILLATWRAAPSRLPRARPPRRTAHPPRQRAHPFPRSSCCRAFRRARRACR